MILCSCGNTIEYLIAIAHEPYTSLNRTERPIILSNGAYFACEKCCDRIVTLWERHNKSRTVPYAIQTAKISVKAETKKDFASRALPQIISQFKPLGWYVPKTDIQQALAGTKKVKE